LVSRSLRKPVLDRVLDKVRKKLTDRPPIIGSKRLELFDNFRLWTKTHDWSRHWLFPFVNGKHR
jgi:hypothetical protein